MVSGATRNVLRHSPSVSSHSSSTDGREGSFSSPSSQRRAGPDRLEVVRNSFRSQGLSGYVSDLLVAGNRPATIAAYDSGWRNWVDWCFQRGSDSLSPSLAVVLEFLAELYRSGKSFSSINSHRSMLSKTLTPIDGHPIGCHPLVKNLLKACYNLNPPKAKYAATWDPEIVLSFVSTLGQNQTLDLPT